MTEGEGSLTRRAHSPSGVASRRVALREVGFKISQSRLTSRDLFEHAVAGMLWPTRFPPPLPPSSPPHHHLHHLLLLLLLMVVSRSVAKNCVLLDEFARRP